MKAIDTHEYRGCTIEVHHDPDPINPRKECDNVGTMVCWHGRYDLGDEQPKQSPSEYLEELARPLCFDDRYAVEKRSNRAQERVRDWGHKWWRGIQVAFEKREQSIIAAALHGNYVILPLYLYDHGGITISTGRLSCPWDSSGKVGFIYCTMERARDEWGEKYNPGITDDGIREKAIAYLESEVETYDNYLTGSIYGYETKDPDGNDIEACWGFSGYDETKFHEQHDKCGYMIQQARDSIDHWCKKRAKEDTERAYWNEREVITKG